MKFILLAVATGLLTGAAAPALATHNHPGSTVPAVIPLVRAFTQCPSTPLTHNLSFAFPSCAPLPASQFRIVPPGNFGWVQYQYQNISGPDLRIRAKIRTVLDNLGNLYNGNLVLGFYIRLTDHDCTGGAPCTTQDFQFGVLVPCGPGVSQPPGTCFVNTTMNNVLAGAINGFAQRNFEFGPFEVYDVNHDLFMKQGAFVP